MEAVILGEVCVGEVREGRVSYFSFPHRTRPTHDLSWGLTIRIRRLLGPFEPVQASAVDDGLPLADIKVPIDYTKDRLSGRQRRFGTALPGEIRTIARLLMGLG